MPYAPLLDQRVRDDGGLDRLGLLEGICRLRYSAYGLGEGRLRMRMRMGWRYGRGWKDLIGGMRWEGDYEVSCGILGGWILRALVAFLGVLVLYTGCC